jgi:nucleotide-binding universal stress UspA family protein
MLAFAIILVCVDGSESSIKAADYAIEMARKYDAQLISLYVVVSQLGYAYSSGAFGLVTPNAINELLDKSKQEARKWFDEIEKKAMAQGVNVKVEMVASPTSIVPAIVDYAEKNKVDLIVTGTKGRRRSGLAKLLLGSVASGVVTYANCPVMVVKYSSTIHTHYFIPRLPFTLSWVLGSASLDTGTEGLLTFLVGLGVSSNSSSLACSVSSGCLISFLWLM